MNQQKIDSSMQKLTMQTTAFAKETLVICALGQKKIVDNKFFIQCELEIYEAYVVKGSRVNKKTKDCPSPQKSQLMVENCPKKPLLLFQMETITALLQGIPMALKWNETWVQNTPRKITIDERWRLKIKQLSRSRPNQTMFIPINRPPSKLG